MARLKSAVLYNLSTKLKAVGIFYIIQYSVFSLICVIIALCTEVSSIRSNTPEVSTAVFISIMSVLSFKADFKALLQNGYTRRYIFLSTELMFAALALLMAVIDTAIGLVLRLIFPGYFTFFSFLYGGGAVQSILWHAVVYLMFCNIFYLAVLIQNKVGKMTSLLIGVGLVGGLLVIAALFRYVLPAQFVGGAVRFALRAMGFMGDGTKVLLFPILTFLGAGAVLGSLSFAMIRRAELR